MGKSTTTLVFAKGKKGRHETTIPGWLKASVVVILGPDKGKQCDLTEHCTVIGREAEVDLVLADASVSRRHASIVYKNLEFRLRDLESANGTLLNGSAVKEYVIHNGDKITTGETVLKFLVEKVSRTP